MIATETSVRPGSVSLTKQRFVRSTAVLALAAAGGLIVAGVASAAPAVGGDTVAREFPTAQILTFLFLMLGPFKIIGPFVHITKGADAALSHRIALLATLFASITLLVSAFVGELILAKYGIPLPILALAAGIILFLVALQSTLKQFAPLTSGDEMGAPPPPDLKTALTPLAFPTIVTPYGIGALVVFLALSPGLQGQLTIGAIVLVIMLLNLIVMWAARYIGSVLGIALAILGAVIGIIQIALGLNIINNSLTALGLL